jgi:KUP system potassium uptake protein
VAPCPRAAAVPLADTAIFLNRGSAATPLATRANVGHHQVLREHVAFILAIETAPVPYVPPARRFRADDLGYKDDRISHVTATFGYMDSPDVPGLLCSKVGTRTAYRPRAPAASKHPHQDWHQACTQVTRPNRITRFADPPGEAYPGSQGWPTR